MAQVSKLRADFRDQVWGFWQLSVFGETDFPYQAKTEEGAIYVREEFFNYERYKKFAPDLDRDPYYRWLNRYFLLLQILLGLLLHGLDGTWGLPLWSSSSRSSFWVCCGERR